MHFLCIDLKSIQRALVVRLFYTNFVIYNSVHTKETSQCMQNHILDHKISSYIILSNLFWGHYFQLAMIFLWREKMKVDHLKFAKNNIQNFHSEKKHSQNKSKCINFRTAHQDVKPNWHLFSFFFFSHFQASTELNWLPNTIDLNFPNKMKTKWFNIILFFHILYYIWLLYAFKNISIEM